MAFVVVGPGTRHRAPRSSSGAAAQMANYKVPRAVEIVDELPLNATGKVMKETLRERAARPDRRDGQVTGPEPTGLGALAGPARRRARRLGRRPGGVGPAGGLGRRRDQGRAADGRPHAQCLRFARDRQGLPEPGLRAGQPGEAERRPRPARPRGPAPVRGAARHGRRLPQQPAPGRARRPRPGAGEHRGPPSPPRVLQRQRVRAARTGPEPSGLRHRRLLGPIGPVGPVGQQRGRPAQRPRRHRRPHQRARRAGRAAGRRARAAPDRAAGGSSRCRCCGPAPTSSGGTSACRRPSARSPGPRRGTRTRHR